MTRDDAGGWVSQNMGSLMGHKGADPMDNFRKEGIENFKG